MGRKADTKQVLVYLPDDLRVQLRLDAAKLGISMSELVRRALVRCRVRSMPGR
jgi:Ribbon-helix-helix protein, copG family